ncbi:MAG TPA: ATP-binding cassette domain-containing protein, partial [Opitutales bacterium]|nr:ATP-binding cassette domain-containing protein [Opitutales bacterium]
MLTLSQIGKSFAGRTLFRDVNLQINRGDRIGLVGPNGAGKSTLFSIILGENSPDEGSQSLERNATIGFLPQESAPGGDETILDLATSASPEVIELQKRIRAFEAGESDDLEGYHESRERFADLGGFELEPRAKKILSGLAFRESDFDRPARTLSGGWIMRAHLARLLAMEPDLLMLDEPTNHLDLESLTWF